MSDIPTQFPTVPPLLTNPLRVMPLAPLTQALTMLARRLVAHNPGLISRLGPYVKSSFAIAPTDLPLTLLLHPHPTAMRVNLHRQPPAADARIAGPLSALLGLVHGTWDGDALFFSRDLVIDGDTSAALALRNAIDDCELDLGAEIAGFSGPLRLFLIPLIDFAERGTGIPLRRVEGRP